MITPLIKHGCNRSYPLWHGMGRSFQHSNTVATLDKIVITPGFTTLEDLSSSYGIIAS